MKGLGWMNRLQALKTLGLSEDASEDEIKIAYKQSAQILHPDKFASNKKLQERATEQFKNIQEAFDYLKKHPYEDAKSTRGKCSVNDWDPTKGAAENQSDPRYSQSSRTTQAKIAGINAARLKIVEQRDNLREERKIALVLLILGLLVFFAFRRFVFALAAGAIAAIYGVGRTLSLTRAISSIDSKLAELEAIREQIYKEEFGELTKKPKAPRKDSVV